MTALSKDPARLHETLLDTHTDDGAVNALLLSAANYVRRTEIETMPGDELRLAVVDLFRSLREEGFWRTVFLLWLGGVLAATLHAVEPALRALGLIQ